MRLWKLWLTSFMMPRPMFQRLCGMEVSVPVSGPVSSPPPAGDAAGDDAEAVASLG
jgi:hypothetical protein